MDIRRLKIVVMGGSRGIGRAVTLGFAERGANVAACGRSPDALDTLAHDMGHTGRKTYMAACDVGDAGAVSAFVSKAAAALDGIDVLVNCASAVASGNDDGVWSASFNVDLLGSVHATDAALSFLKRSAHASIVNMASVAALKPVPVRPAYGAIKAAVMHQTTSSALALAADGIRVNCVVPGSTEAPGGKWELISRSDPGLYRETRANIPLGRLATPEDVARVVLFLASPTQPGSPARASSSTAVRASSGPRVSGDRNRPGAARPVPSCWQARAAVWSSTTSSSTGSSPIP